ncbi:hypothetical protein N7452_002412 [Penicillium brevicompactum]|uniref:Ankyrin repeat protein n=1 Tax=Penicillium brevicompactum TaxID=5074 RepID=A0A9W9UJR3_PENBR|nr:hypothetical protein N7452_002412 [Penicillium brevicompactum]
MQGGQYRSALQATYSTGHNQIVHVLLERGVDINATCSTGYNQIVHMLLEWGVDINAWGGYYRTTLYAACSIGHD